MTKPMSITTCAIHERLLRSLNPRRPTSLYRISYFPYYIYT